MRDLLLTFFPSCFGCDKANVCHRPSFTVFFTSWADQEQTRSRSAQVSFCVFSLTLSHFVFYEIAFGLPVLFVHLVSSDTCMLTCASIVSCGTQPSVSDCSFHYLCSLGLSKMSCHWDHAEYTLLLNI